MHCWLFVSHGSYFFLLQAIAMPQELYCSCCHRLAKAFPALDWLPQVFTGFLLDVFSQGECAQPQVVCHSQALPFFSTRLTSTSIHTAFPSPATMINPGRPFLSFLNCHAKNSDMCQTNENNCFFLPPPSRKNRADSGYSVRKAAAVSQPPTQGSLMAPTPL